MTKRAEESGTSAPTPPPLIGVIDDDRIMGESLLLRLRLEGYRVVWWQSGFEALEQFREAGCHVLISDIRLPDLDGEQLFRRVLPDLGATPVIFITAYGEIEQAVRLMRAGADDYVTKPFEVDVLLHKIAALCDRGGVSNDGSQSREFRCFSAAMHAIEFELLRIKDTASPVLLLGETGVGKEVAAHLLHDASLRKEQPFVTVSCATIPLERAETEMFGRERRSGVGARNARVGLVEQAGEGTLFLDEVAALATPLQSKLLRLLEDGTYRRVGGTEELVSKARIVSSSNANMSALVDSGHFRRDLYYRLNTIEICIPPLRVRRDDIVSLADYYLALLARGAGYRVPSLTPPARAALIDYFWPGNVRELRNRLERAISVTAGGPQISASAVFPEQTLIREPEERVGSLAEARERAERLHIEEAIRQTHGEITKAAILLGISRTTLWEKMRRLGL
jgi:DNA-binding NtrC family response regulator